MKLTINKRALVTTDNWFIAPDGKEYKAAFGTILEISNSEQVLGIKTNSRSTNWYVKIGNLYIAGCQIQYVIETEQCNLGDMVEGWTADTEHGCVVYQRPNKIYFADGEYSMEG